MQQEKERHFLVKILLSIAGMWAIMFRFVQLWDEVAVDEARKRRRR